MQELGYSTSPLAAQSLEFKAHNPLHCLNKALDRRRLTRKLYNLLCQLLGFTV